MILYMNDFLADRRVNLLLGRRLVFIPHKAPGSSNGRTSAFGAENSRSNRGPGALCRKGVRNLVTRL